MAQSAEEKLNWLAQKVNAGEIETVLVAFADHYGRLMGKRFEAEFFVEQVALHGTHGCDYLLTTDMEMEPVQGYRFANWELGYGDFHLVPDLSTLRPASWLEKSAIVLCDLEDERTHRLVEVAPRTLLRRQLERAKALGYTVMAASELEYYLYRVAYAEAHRQGYAGLEPAGYYLEDYHLLQGTREEPFTAAARRHLKASGIPVENSKGEWGLGQHEVNVRYAEALEMADRHVLFKQCLKEIADSMGLSVTFMAKPHHGQAGSSCHVHLSLWKDGQNAFAGEESYGPIRGSTVFGQFLAGWIAHVPDLMPFYAPTVNSYKRYEDGSWAPTRLAWSYDNRTAGFRVVGHGSSLRIECRIGGADLNPYLALAAALASGLAGIEQGLTPPPIFQGDIYQARHLPRVPYTLGEAVEGFAHSAFAKGVLGEAVHEHYTHFFRTEWQAFNRAVTDWERKRYFERI
ncbi:glutamine synthetase family protein [Meiothermus hypogaeus]|uniref:Glutamine synthetase n=2 Tax=Meiothermus hypogaeus TaxID=884155 RepID=A0A511R4X7_9DEIN|nr:glutamine synthetase family protein [Meiothermus hypogaeus]RIH75997.1 Glutamate--isopropylamine ligase [Meiothermus hypogaeus]GEM83942.1 glutamine synthetase [Meiothermus hypogaeus NBRC 106114]